MILNEGEVKCSKCNGGGSLYETHSHHVHGNSHAVASVCTKCNGAGKLDWISNIMKSIDHNAINYTSMPAHTHGHSHALPVASESVFDGIYDDPSIVNFYCEGEEVISIRKDGFYVRGNKVVNDLEIYEEFKTFINTPR